MAGRVGLFLERREADEALRRAEEQLRQAMKMDAVGKLAGGVAHDFNNLLTVILGRCIILLPQMPEGTVAHRGLTLIQQTAQRAAALTRQLLAFSRKQVLQPQPLDFSEVVEGITPQGHHAAPLARGTETVLLVEDEADVRELAADILGELGYTVLAAEGPDHALTAAASHSGTIHLLLTDVVMPGSSGRDLADRLTPLRRGMKVLYMSGYTDHAIVHHGVLDPGLAYIEKPSTPEDLARKVPAVLDDKDGSA